MMNKRISKRAGIPLIALIAVAGIGLGSWLAKSIKQPDRLPPGLEATVLPEARPLSEFSLVDHDGRPFTLDNLRGQWSFLFFGFTNCPDICPTTLTVMQSVWKKLATQPGQAGQPKLFFISVDPDRDSLDLLKKYVTYFNASFVGVTGGLDEIDNLTGQLGVLYGYDEQKSKGNNDYIVNHSAQLLLIDPAGRMRAVISPPHDSSTIARNYQIIAHYYGER